MGVQTCPLPLCRWASRWITTSTPTSSRKYRTDTGANLSDDAIAETAILPIRGVQVGAAGAREGRGHRGAARWPRHHARSRQGTLRAVLPRDPEAAAEL